MNYLISESQYNRLIELIEKYLNEKLSLNSNIICDVKVYPAEYENEEQIKFDIYVYMNLNFTKVYNQYGLYGVKKGIESKIIKYMKNVFGIEDHEFYIGYSAKDCEK